MQLKNVLISTVAMSVIILSPLSVLAAEYESNGQIEFIPNTDSVSPVDPTNPENPISPVDPLSPDGKPNVGTTGPLSIDYASSLDFGTNKISNKDMMYYAKAQEIYGDEDVHLPNYVQVSDNLGTNGGWALTVKQEGQFKNNNTQNKELIGSQIQLQNGEAISNAENMQAPNVSQNIILNPDGAAALVMEAEKTAGAGTWLSRWGGVEETVNDVGETVYKTKTISLNIPGKTPKDAVKYSTTLTWNLSDIPDNK
ncbi:WxL domain-containing protein [Listeria sp. SHR_NRA_18]|uniref:WxL domain-containing protein n=1 Tax=Listeria sp. SHR_NRA_18 TaxID=2269046 RepID=UPI000A7E93F0|nr:WxL domain-containing protein [Listeria sp. SHR_NRA_18]